MKLIVDLFTMQKNGVPSVTSQENKLKKGWTFSIVQPGDIGEIPSIKIIRTGFLKFKLEVKSDNYRKFEIKTHSREES